MGLYLLARQTFEKKPIPCVSQARWSLNAVRLKQDATPHYIRNASLHILYKFFSPRDIVHYTVSFLSRNLYKGF